ncbi:polyphenol oxidase family protein [Candidatus Uhrbacteria bacterium]|nr:polyphenol oxidase family protein [Candidatus Uhrbacteria bacterium]
MIEGLTPEQNKREMNPERIEEGVWRPGILQPFEASVGAGMSTKLLKEAIGTTGGVRITGKRDRFNTPFDQATPEERLRRFTAGRILARLLERIAPEVDPHKITKTALVHERRIVHVDEQYLKQDLRTLANTEADGLITSMKGVPLMVAAADCAPVGVYDDARKAIGVFHSGWKSTAQQIVPRGIDAMHRQFGSSPDGLHVFIGPYSGANIYEVGSDVYDQFRGMKTADDAPYYTENELQSIFKPHTDPAKSGKYFFDNGAAIRLSVIKAGVPEDHIELSQHATMEEPQIFSSERIEGADKRDSNVTLMVLRSDERYRAINGKRYPLIKIGEFGAPIDQQLMLREAGFYIDYVQSPALQELYAKIRLAVQEMKSEQEILGEVKNIVHALFAISDKRSVERFDAQQRKKDGPLINIETFAAAGCGYCSHCSVVGALMIEKLKEEGILSGAVAIEDAYWSNEFVARGHMWVHYKDESGAITVVDIAQNFIGTEQEYASLLLTLKEEDLLDF